ncbi:hypothetical protein DAHU10_035730 [Hanseniaspora uvarum]|nr:hypothetical protein DAHU10_035730 [Hanseniaspora uvarum]
MLSKTTHIPFYANHFSEIIIVYLYNHETRFLTINDKYFIWNNNQKNYKDLRSTPIANFINVFIYLQ